MVFNNSLGRSIMPQETIGNVILSHQGPLKYETIGNLINVLKDKMDNLGISIVIYKKLLLAMIESLENIYKYNEPFRQTFQVPDGFHPCFSMEKEDSKFIITSSNAIDNNDAQEITSKINRVNHLDDKGLKMLYKETITNGKFSKRGGAGLGFIEIAKIATEDLKYNFDPIDKDHSYYTLQITINEDNYKN